MNLTRHFQNRSIYPKHLPLSGHPPLTTYCLLKHASLFHVYAAIYIRHGRDDYFHRNHSSLAFAQKTFNPQRSRALNRVHRLSQQRRRGPSGGNRGEEGASLGSRLEASLAAWLEGGTELGDGDQRGDVAHLRRGIAGAVTSHLVRVAFAAGVKVVWLTPEHDQAERIYARAGFVVGSEVLHISHG